MGEARRAQLALEARGNAQPPFFCEVCGELMPRKRGVLYTYGGICGHEGHEACMALCPKCPEVTDDG